MERAETREKGEDSLWIGVLEVAVTFQNTIHVHVHVPVTMYKMVFIPPKFH